MTVPMDLQPAGLGPAKIGRRGLMLVLSSPSGAGKTTIARRMLQRNSSLTISVSVTTRPPRPGEIHGVHYQFVSDEEFDALIAAGELLEWATVHGTHRYGTPRAPVVQAIAAGRPALLEIDLQGARQVKASWPHARSKEWRSPQRDRTPACPYATA